jgi:hypothetical protein
MKKIIITIGIIAVCGSIFAQDINQEKMNRDLEVAETILKGLVDNKQGQTFWLSRERQINAQHIEGYGVVITLPIEKNAFQFNVSRVYSRWPEVSEAVNYAIEDLESENDISYYYHVDTSKQDNDDLNTVLKNQRKEQEKKQEQWENKQEQWENEQEQLENQQAKWEFRQRDLEQRQYDIEQRARSFALRTLKSLNTDSMNRADFNKNLENIKIFMLDYGQVISQLKDAERIKIISKGTDNSYYRTENGTMEQESKYNEFSAEIQMKDVRAYQNGKLSKEEAENRIKINNKNEEKPIGKDLAVFKSVINRLYQSDLSETYFLKSDISTEEVEGLGTILYLEMASSQKTNQYFSMPTQGNLQFNQSERDDKVKALYPKFEEDLINNILEYGKYLSSMADNAKLIFKVTITECKGCGIPAQLEIQVESSTLKALKSGKIDEKVARKEIKIVEGRTQ